MVAAQLCTVHFELEHFFRNLRITNFFLEVYKDNLMISGGIERFLFSPE